MAILQTNNIQLTASYTDAEKRSSTKVIESARRALQQVQGASPIPARRGPATGQRDVYHLLVAAVDVPPTAAPAASQTAVAPEPPLSPVSASAVTSPTTRDLLVILCDSLDAARREAAASALANADPKATPELD